MKTFQGLIGHSYLSPISEPHAVAQCPPWSSAPPSIATHVACSDQAHLPADWLGPRPGFPWHPQVAAQGSSPRMPPQGIIADILP